MLFFFSTPALYPRFLIFVKFAPLMGVPIYIIDVTKRQGSRRVGLLNITGERLANAFQTPSSRSGRGQIFGIKKPRPADRQPGKFSSNSYRKASRLLTGVFSILRRITVASVSMLSGVISILFKRPVPLLW